MRKSKPSASTSPNTAKRVTTARKTQAVHQTNRVRCAGLGIESLDWHSGTFKQPMEAKKKNMSTPKQVLEMAKKAGARMVDVKFVDTFGTWQHFTLPISELSEGSFTEGLGFDGSSIRGWKSIEASDMLAVPDPDTAFIDPFMAE